MQKLHLLAKSCVRGCIPGSCRSKYIQGEIAHPRHVDSATHFMLGGFVLSANLLLQVLPPAFTAHWFGSMESNLH